MENKIENKENKENAGLDVEAVETMVADSIYKTISDPKLMNRALLNCFCELMGELKDMKKQFDEFMETISIASADKVTEFFTKTKDNLSKETKRANARAKVAKSHQKSKKATKISKKV